MRLSGKAVAACVLLSFSPLSHAEFYGGGSGSVSSLQYDDVKAGFGGKAFVGYKPSSLPMAFEVGYLSSGKNKVDGEFTDGSNYFTNVGVSLTGEYASLGYYGRFGHTGSGGFAKLGYFTGKSKLSADVNGFPGSVKENTGGAILSFGVDWMLTRNFGFRFDLDALLGIKDYRSFDDSHTGTMTLGNVGVVFAFGGDESAYEPRRRRAASAPVYSPPVAAPVYSPAVALAPGAEPVPAYAAPVSAVPPLSAPASAPPAAATGTAQLVPGAVLRSGPSMSSAAIKSLPDGGAVKLMQRVSNAEGPWWSVQLEDGTTGWMIEWGLTRISKH